MVEAIEFIFCFVSYFIIGFLFNFLVAALTVFDFKLHNKQTTFKDELKFLFSKDEEEDSDIILAIVIMFLWPMILMVSPVVLLLVFLNFLAKKFYRFLDKSSDNC